MGRTIRTDNMGRLIRTDNMGRDSIYINNNSNNIYINNNSNNTKRITIDSAQKESQYESDDESDNSLRDLLLERGKLARKLRDVLRFPRTFTVYVCMYICV